MQSSVREPVLVTGALGCIGSSVIELLLRSGVSHIVAFDLPGKERPLPWDDRVEYAAGDICQPADVERAMRDVAAVIHLAAPVGANVSLQRQRQIAIGGSRSLFEAALRQGARVTLASSIVVYGDRLYEPPFTEDKPWGRPMSPYSICKQEQERLAWHYCKRRNMPLSVVRLANVYGPRSRPWVDNIIPVLKSGLPLLVSGGDFNASLIYVENAAELLILASSSDMALGEAYHGDDSSCITWKQYLADLSKALQLPFPKRAPYFLMLLYALMAEGLNQLRLPLPYIGETVYSRESLNLMRQASCLSIAKARQQLGYCPKISYQEGLDNLVAWLEAAPFNWQAKGR